MAELAPVMEGDRDDTVFVNLEVPGSQSPPEYASTEAMMLMSQASNIPLLLMGSDQIAHDVVVNGVGDTHPPNRSRSGTMSSSHRPDAGGAADGKTAVALTTRPAWRQILGNWRLAVIVLTPFVLLPLLFVQTNIKPAKAAYVVILMAIYWCTEVLPLAATSLIPIFLVPMLGLMKSSDVCMNYLKDLNFLFVGGLMFAVAVEKWNLHKRLALKVVLIVGTKPGMLMFGFLSVTGFLSMWLSNTAATAMMIPIAESVLKEMWISHKKHIDRLKKGEESDDDHIELPSGKKHESDDKYDLRNADPYFKNLCKALALSICMGSNIGGTGTLTGTGPNLVIGEVMLEYFPESNDISFGSWMIFAVPLMVLSLILAWIVLQIMFLGPRALFRCFSKKKEESHLTEETEKEAKEIIREEYYKLGPLSCAEIALVVFFFILVILWLLRDPKMFEGWHVIFRKGYVTDASVGIFVCLFLFAFPSSFPCMKNSKSKKSGKSSYKLGPPLLDWHSVQQKLPWGVIILLGGGFAMADVCKESGLSDWLGCQLAAMKDVSPTALSFAATVLMSFLTQFTSNTSSANILLPIMAELAIIIHVHPVYLMVPVTMAASFSFIFPISTPPNAIVFSYGHLKVVDMAKSGAVLTIGCILLTALAINTWGSAYWKLGEFPHWAAAMTNGTASTCH